MADPSGRTRKSQRVADGRAFAASVAEDGGGADLVHKAPQRELTKQEVTDQLKNLDKDKPWYEQAPFPAIDWDAVQENAIVNKMSEAEAVDAAEVLRGFYADGTDGEQVDRSADEQPPPSATFTEDDERDPFMAGDVITASLDAELDRL